MSVLGAVIGIVALMFGAVVLVTVVLLFARTLRPLRECERYAVAIDEAVGNTSASLERGKPGLLRLGATCSFVPDIASAIAPGGSKEGRP